MEAWEKVLVNAEFPSSTHGELGCVTCHDGDDGIKDKEKAHKGIVPDPSVGKSYICEDCHNEIVDQDAVSLHSSLHGFKSALEVRGGNMERGSTLDIAFENHCTKCHTSCGQCHISRPDQSGGGLVSGHAFLKTPSFQYECYSCHGRPGPEYIGAVDRRIPADVHWVKARMTCTDCHKDELHGSGRPVTHRYQNTLTVQCDGCHEDIMINAKDNPQHAAHLGKLQCQVCHSVSYKNCYECHVGMDPEGLPFRQSEPTEIGFKIGLNPLKSSHRPYKYVVLRHAPVSVSTFEFYGNNLLPNFNAAPTWKYATPHNIQRKTPQNKSCNACHGNIALFLTKQDIRPKEKKANKSVIVNDIPDLR